MEKEKQKFETPLSHRELKSAKYLGKRSQLLSC